MELFDIVDQQGEPTGKTVERSKAHEDGIRHRTAHVWIVREKGGVQQVLLQKRAQGKDSFPGCYDTSSAGHVTAGDEPLDSAVRELKEELGIEADEKDLEFISTFEILFQKEFYGRMFKDEEVAFLYIYRKPVDISQITVQKEEVDSVEWFDVDYVAQAIEAEDERFCVPPDGFAIIRNLLLSQDAMLSGMMGLVTGDALGCPVQFLTREELKRRGPVADMEGHGTFDMPAGTWTDDSSMALASLAGIREKGTVDSEDIMERFVDWEINGAYTPYGFAFDQGITCTDAIYRFDKTHDIFTCGKTGEHANGNGALMRILPVCIYWVQQELKDPKNFSVENAVRSIHQVTGLTHNHLRSHIASGLYYFMARAIMMGRTKMHASGVREDNAAEMLKNLLQQGLDQGFAFYEADKSNLKELSFYDRTRNLEEFELVSESGIRSSGYVLHSFEASVWCLITTDSFEKCLLKAVNLGEDTDTTAAIAGGLAGLFYGYSAIPDGWLDAIVKRQWVESFCR